MIGDTVNVAARLEVLRPAGEVLLGAETRAQLGAAVIAEAAGPFELKGKSEAIPAWRLLAITTPDDTPALPGVHPEDGTPPPP